MLRSTPLELAVLGTADPPRVLNAVFKTSPLARK
jgi:hypothetical protein